MMFIACQPISILVSIVPDGQCRCVLASLPFFWLDTHERATIIIPPIAVYEREYLPPSHQPSGTEMAAFLVVLLAVLTVESAELCGNSEGLASAFRVVG